MTPTAAQVAIVKSTAPIIKEHGEHVTQVFYHNLLRDHPALNNYFSVRNQHTGAQQSALAAAVFAYATYIDNLAVLSSAVEKIAQKHASLFVQPEHYPIVGEYLIGALGEVLGDALTADVKDAWIAAYNQLAEVFIGAEKGLYEAAGEWQTWRPFKITQKVAETESITNFYLKPSDGLSIPTFVPGQYVSVQVTVPKLNGLLQSRQFSLSENPVAGMQGYRITVKKENFGDIYSEADMMSGKSPGLISGIMHDSLQVGDEIHLSPPYGVFRLAENSSGSQSEAPVVLISAGVGATPLLPMLEHILESPDSTRPVIWVHGARNSKAICYGQYVRDLSKKHENLTRCIFVKDVVEGESKGEDYDETGRLNVDTLEGTNTLRLQDITSQYYICGPEAFMKEMQQSLKQKGVGEDRIHLELFRVGAL